jgi:hypothetical protein
LATTCEEISLSTNFVAHLADTLNYDTTTCALLLNSMLEHVPLMDLDVSSTVKTCFRTIYFAPDNKSTAVQCEAISHTHLVEELCGKHNTNLSKVQTNIHHDM